MHASDDNADDLLFHELLSEHFAEHWENGFYTKVSGVSHKNDDGSSRQKAIKTCKPFDIVVLEHQPDNPFDPNAVAVIHKSSGVQVGYLDRRIAAEVVREYKKSGQQWLALVRRAIRAEGTPLYGLVLYMMRVDEISSASENEAP